MRIRRTPQMSAAFDSNTLDTLQENINIHLMTVLEDMRMQLNKETLDKEK